MKGCPNSGAVAHGLRPGTAWDGLGWPGTAWDTLVTLNQRGTNGGLELFAFNILFWLTNRPQGRFGDDKTWKRRRKSRGIRTSDQDFQDIRKIEKVTVEGTQTA